MSALLPEMRPRGTPTATSGATRAPRRSQVTVRTGGSIETTPVPTYFEGHHSGSLETPLAFGNELPAP